MSNKWRLLPLDVHAEEYLGTEPKLVDASSGLTANPGDWVVTYGDGRVEVVLATDIGLRFERKKDFSPVGSIGIADIRGNFPYVRVDSFESDSVPGLMEEINGYFQRHPGLMVVAPPTFFESLCAVGRKYVAVYHFTRTMDDAEIEESRRVGEKVKQELEKERAKEAELSAETRTAMVKAKFEREQQAKKELQELQSLAALGRKCRDNHAKDKKKGKK